MPNTWPVGARETVRCTYNRRHGGCSDGVDLSTRVSQAEIPQTTTRAPVPATAGTRRTFHELIRDDPLSTIVTVSIDVVSASIAVAMGIWWVNSGAGASPPLWTLVLFVPILVVIFTLRGVYRRGLNRRFLDEVGGVMTGCTIAAIILLCSLLLSFSDDRPGAAVTKVWVSALFWVPFGRLIRDTIQRSLRRSGHLLSPTLIIGDGPITAQVVGRMVSAPEHGLRPVGILAAGAPPRADRDEGPTNEIAQLEEWTNSTRRSVPRRPRYWWWPSRSPMSKDSPPLSVSPIGTASRCGSCRGCSTSSVDATGWTTSAACP